MPRRSVTPAQLAETFQQILSPWKVTHSFFLGKQFSTTQRRSWKEHLERTGTIGGPIRVREILQQPQPLIISRLPCLHPKESWRGFQENIFWTLTCKSPFWTEIFVVCGDLFLEQESICSNTVNSYLFCFTNLVPKIFLVTKHPFFFQYLGLPMISKRSFSFHQYLEFKLLNKSSTCFIPDWIYHRYMRLQSSFMLFLIVHWVPQTQVTIVYPSFLFGWNKYTIKYRCQQRVHTYQQQKKSTKKSGFLYPKHISS